MKSLYAIRDNVAGQIQGGVHLHSQDAPAVRFFRDLAADPQTLIARHLADYDLLILGTIDEESGEILPMANGPQVILTGAALKAAGEAADSLQRQG